MIEERRDQLWHYGDRLITQVDALKLRINSFRGIIQNEYKSIAGISFTADEIVSKLKDNKNGIIDRIKQLETIMELYNTALAEYVVDADNEFHNKGI